MEFGIDQQAEDCDVDQVGLPELVSIYGIWGCSKGRSNPLEQLTVTMSQWKTMGIWQGQLGGRSHS